MTPEVWRWYTRSVDDEPAPTALDKHDADHVSSVDIHTARGHSASRADG